MTLFERLTKKAQEHPQRIVLPESTEPRTLKAAEEIIEKKIANVTFIGNPDEIHAKADELGLTLVKEAQVVNPLDAAFVEKYAQIFYELRKNKGESDAPGERDIPF